MTKELKNTNEFQLKDPSEQQGYRLPYELPKLRKHGKVNDITLLTFSAPGFDGFTFSGDLS
jgi:hypothetical protein